MISMWCWANKRGLRIFIVYIACMEMQTSDIVFPSLEMDHTGMKKALLDSGNKSCFIKNHLSSICFLGESPKSGKIPSDKNHLRMDVAPWCFKVFFLFCYLYCSSGTYMSPSRHFIAVNAEIDNFYGNFQCVV